MSSYKFLTLLVLFSVVLSPLGCKSGGSKPTNPFAQNQTVPPPSTFSSQEQYLGQTPGGFVPQTPATTYPPPASGSPAPTQPMSLPVGVPVSNTTNSNTENESAKLYASKQKESDWQPVEVVSTSHTAFQAMEAKTASTSPEVTGSNAEGVPESLVVGTSHVVTTVTDESQPAEVLSEPMPLYSGNFTK